MGTHNTVNILFPMFALRYVYPDVYVQFWTSALVSIFVSFVLFSLVPPPTKFYHKEKVDNMVVFHVSTFILQLRRVGG